MKQLRDHPVIERLINYGVPEAECFACPDCGEDLCGTVYEVDTGFVCFDCFKETVIDWIGTNPEMIAKALNCRTKYME